jgi:hypothetical protein
VVDQVDWIVSMAKMKTHHWAGVTLSLKNMLGDVWYVYGWPMNVFHWPRHRSWISTPPPSPFRHYRWHCRYGGRRPHPGTPKTREPVLGENPRPWTPLPQESWGSTLRSPPKRWPPGP